MPASLELPLKQLALRLVNSHEASAVGPVQKKRESASGWWPKGTPPARPFERSDPHALQNPLRDFISLSDMVFHKSALALAGKQTATRRPSPTNQRNERASGTRRCGSPWTATCQREGKRHRSSIHAALPL